MATIYKDKYAKKGFGTAKFGEDTFGDKTGYNDKYPEVESGVPRVKTDHEDKYAKKGFGTVKFGEDTFGDKTGYNDKY